MFAKIFKIQIENYSLKFIANLLQGKKKEKPEYRKIEFLKWIQIQLINSPNKNFHRIKILKNKKSHVGSMKIENHQ